MSIWSRLTGRRYSAVEAEDNEFVNPRGFRRKSSVVVNQFFGNAMPVRSDGRLQWSKSEFLKKRSFFFVIFFFLVQPGNQQTSLINNYLLIFFLYEKKKKQV